MPQNRVRLCTLSFDSSRAFLVIHLFVLCYSSSNLNLRVFLVLHLLGDVILMLVK